MLKSGLVSITFRKLSPRAIVDLVEESSLCGIEWGADIHVPPGDVKNAQEVRMMTVDAGISVAAYGSYYRLGNYVDFRPVLDSAIALNAPIVRVWAGNKGSKDISAYEREEIIMESRKIADAAESAGISIAYEYHEGTLMDTDDSAVKLLKEVRHNNIFTCWQLPNNMTIEQRIKGLNGIMHKLNNIHVFSWKVEDGKYRRLDLASSKKEWELYFDLISQKKDDNSYAMLEFVKDDSIEQFKKDAETLKDLIKGANK